jgi:hypothetical protein
MEGRSCTLSLLPLAFIFSVVEERKSIRAGWVGDGLLRKREKPRTRRICGSGQLYRIFIPS